MKKPPELFVAVERFDGNLPCKAIDAWTRAPLSGCHPPWVLKDGPAIHAFVILGHSDGFYYRLDGQMPRSAWSPANVKFKNPTAVWHVTMAEQNIWDGVRRAWQLTGVPYDLGEIFGHGVGPVVDAVVGLVDPVPLPAELEKLVGEIRGLAKNPFAEKSYICTSLAGEVLKACGGRAKDAIEGMPNFFTETLARTLENESHKPGAFVTRVML